VYWDEASGASQYPTIDVKKGKVSSATLAYCAPPIEKRSTMRTEAMAAEVSIPPR